MEHGAQERAADGLPDVRGEVVERERRAVLRLPQRDRLERDLEAGEAEPHVVPRARKQAGADEDPAGGDVARERAPTGTAAVHRAVLGALDGEHQREALVAAAAAELRARDVEVQGGDGGVDVQDERRHPHVTVANGRAQLGRAGAQGERRARLEQDAAVARVGVDGREAGRDDVALRHDDVVEALDERLRGRAHADAPVTARELVGAAARMLHVDIVCAVELAAVTGRRGLRIGLRVLGSRVGYLLVLGLYMPATLWLDGHESHGWQYAVDVTTWILLAAAFVAATRVERRQLVAVVCIATCLEVLFSIVWGMYRYRYGNLPMYVPPGHGLIYLGAIRIAGLQPIASRPGRAAGVTAIVVSAWVAGALVLPGHPDVVGLLLLPSLLYLLWRSRRRHVYVGAFVATAILEIVGTRFGNWRWAESVPGLGIPQGNPPSAISAGYALLDTMTLYAAGLPWLHRIPILRAPSPAAVAPEAA
jgi:hypothetical protein